VVVLVGVAAGVGSTGDADRLRVHSSAAVRSVGSIGPGTAGALDTRFQRDTEAGQALRAPHHDGVAGSASDGHSTRPGVRALAGVLERAGHPERIGEILLRGPPRLSA